MEGKTKPLPLQKSHSQEEGSQMILKPIHTVTPRDNERQVIKESRAAVRVL